jgi:alanyl-tRNA synthetase
MSGADWAQVERLVNQIVFENRPIKGYFITADQLKTVPLRRPPKVNGQIRVVEVTAFDYSACGGTHCPDTGMLGLIKVVKTERKNQKLRLHFVAGQQALTYFQHGHELVTELSRHLNTRPEEVVRVVNRQAEQLAAAQREIKRLQVEVLSFEAQQLSAQAELIGAVHLVTRLYPNRSINELRGLAKQLLAQDNLVAVLAGYEDQKLSLVVSCAEGSGISARELLAHFVAQIDGKGSGDARLAQGGGNANPEQVTQLLAQARAFLES